MSKNKIIKILNQASRTKEDLVYLLSFYDKDERQLIYDKSKEIRRKYIGNTIYLRGLIEYSNICAKDCFYCGIRANNKEVTRFTISDADVLKSAEYAYKHNYASLVLQSGEIISKAFTKKITSLLKQIHILTKNSLAITLSCGEQSLKTYKEWYDAGAHRYLLRIESSNKSLYKQIHPNNSKHNFDKRLAALYNLKKIGYQVGTGFMIGLPKQTVEDLADDLLFLKEFNIDMVGMGPYVEHIDTPLYASRNELLSQEKRYLLTLMMYALLRIEMKDINVASTTALDALNPNGRVEALDIASNVLMPNLTPLKYNENYHLYNNKPDSLHADKLVQYIEKHKHLHGNKIGFGEQGSSQHFYKRIHLKRTTIAKNKKES